VNDQPSPTQDDALTLAEPAGAETSLVEILSSYAAAGFTTDMFVAEDGRLECGQCGTTTAADRVEVHSIRRLEGASDPADMSAVLAVVCPSCNARATAVLRFGPEATEAEATVFAQTRDCRRSDLLPGDATPAEGDASG
jgi:hypothetical protein